MRWINREPPKNCDTVLSRSTWICSRLVASSSGLLVPETTTSPVGTVLGVLMPMVSEWNWCRHRMATSRDGGTTQKNATSTTSDVWLPWECGLTTSREWSAVNACKDHPACWPTTRNTNTWSWTFTTKNWFSTKRRRAVLISIAVERLQ